jgi:hypothetical protein
VAVERKGRIEHPVIASAPDPPSPRKVQWVDDVDSGASWTVLLNPEPLIDAHGYERAEAGLDRHPVEIRHYFNTPIAHMCKLIEAAYGRDSLRDQRITDHHCGHKTTVCVAELQAAPNVDQGWPHGFQFGPDYTA